MKRKLAITRKTMMVELECGIKKEGTFIAKLNATFKEDTIKEENKIE